jgi:hypothetical protein
MGNESTRLLLPIFIPKELPGIPCPSLSAGGDLAGESGFRRWSQLVNSSALLFSPRALAYDKENWIPQECALLSWRKRD